MTYRIDFSSIAKAEADAAFLAFSQFTTPERSQVWYQGLIGAISSLQEMPRRCGLAKENASTVRILHVRNASQRTLGEPEEED